MHACITIGTKDIGLEFISGGYHCRKPGMAWCMRQEDIHDVTDGMAGHAAAQNGYVADLKGLRYGWCYDVLVGCEYVSGE
jgi:hypothetical protein